MITTDLTTDLVRGVAELEPTARGGVRLHRLPAWARAQTTDPQLALAQAQPAGVRIAFRTGATRVELDVVATKRVYPGAPPRPDGVHELSVDGEVIARTTVDGGDTITLDLATGRSDLRAGTPSTIAFDLPDGEHDVELWLPHNEETELVALRSDAPLAPLARTRRTWLHHGSSISHGSNAATPDRHVAGTRVPPRRGRPGQPRARRQRAARPVHGPHDARHPRRPGQPQARPQPGQHRR